MRKHKSHWLLFGPLTLALLAVPKVQAADEGDDYDTIVSQLSSSTNRASAPKPKQDMLSEAMIHAGVAFANSFSVVTTAGAQRLRAHLEGIEASLGIDLFSRRWIAEGTARSYSDYTTPSTRLSLKEFDLKILNRGLIADRLGYRLGAGLAARYMKVTESVPNTSGSVDYDTSYTTPSSVAMVGLDAFVSDKISLGVESSYRTALISETIDNKAYDVVFRLDAHF